MKQCSPLNEYASFVGAVRKEKKVVKSLEAAIDAAIYKMPDNFALKKFLVGHRAEVKGMFFTEWDQEKAMKYACMEAAEDSRAEEKERVASAMLKKNLPLSLIQDISQLSEQTIRTIANKLGVTVITA